MPHQTATQIHRNQKNSPNNRKQNLRTLSFSVFLPSRPTLREPLRGTRLRGSLKNPPISLKMNDRPQTMPNSQCPMPNSPFPIPNSPFPIPKIHEPFRTVYSPPDRHHFNDGSNSDLRLDELRFATDQRLAQRRLSHNSSHSSPSRSQPGNNGSIGCPSFRKAIF